MRQRLLTVWMLLEYDRLRRKQRRLERRLERLQRVLGNTRVDVLARGKK